MTIQNLNPFLNQFFLSGKLSVVSTQEMPAYHLRPGSSIISEKPSVTPREGDSSLLSRISQHRCSSGRITLPFDYLLVTSCLQDSARVRRERPCFSSLLNSQRPVWDLGYQGSSKNTCWNRFKGKWVEINYLRNIRTSCFLVLWVCPWQTVTHLDYISLNTYTDVSLNIILHI